ncbi:MAG: hypothetical protein WC612_04785 [Bdellovibrionales bacterium]|jgi:hypothetical protein
MTSLFHGGIQPDFKLPSKTPFQRAAREFVSPSSSQPHAGKKGQRLNPKQLHI